MNLVVVFIFLWHSVSCGSAVGQLWVSCRSAVAVAVGLTVVTAVVVTEICRSDVGRTIAVVAAYSSYMYC